MADTELYIFWAIVSALFVFAAVYIWFVARITGDSLPGEMIWLFAGLAFITGINAFIRSGQTFFEPRTLIVISRAAWFVTGINSIITVVMVANRYNGEVSEHLSFKRQARRLWRDVIDGDDAKQRRFVK